MIGVALTVFGSRKYRLWVPARYDSQTTSPLVMMLHGCAQTAQDFAAVSGMNRIADRDNFFAVYPTPWAKSRRSSGAAFVDELLTRESNYDGRRASSVRTSKGCQSVCAP